MNKELIQYIRESVTNDYMSEINFQRYNLEKKLNKEKQSPNDIRT